MVGRRPTGGPEPDRFSARGDKAPEIQRIRWRDGSLVWTIEQSWSSEDVKYRAIRIALQESLIGPFSAGCLARIASAGPYS